MTTNTQSLIDLYRNIYEAHRPFGISPYQEERLQGMSELDLRTEIAWLRDSIRTEIELEAEQMKEWMEAEERHEKECRERAEDEEWSMKWDHYYRRLCR